MTMMHGHTSKDPIMQNLQHNIHQQQCKIKPLFTLINFNNNCIIKYLRPHNQSSHNSIKSHHHIIIIHLAYMQSPTTSPSLKIYAFTNNITINQHICIHQPYHNQSTYMYSPTSTLSYNSTTSYYFSQFK